MTKKPKPLKYGIIILPLVFLWAGLSFERNNYPNDPEYIYLMNALCILDGQSVGHIDNPGTTLIQLSAATAGVIHVFHNPENEKIIERVLRNPDYFIESTRKVLVFLNTLFLLFLGWAVFRKTKSAWIALFFQVSMLTSTYILDVTWAKLSPEPMLFFITGLYALAVLYYYHDEHPRPWRYVFLFALITGAGLGTKATFLPLVIFPVMVLPGLRKKAAFLAALVVSFVLFTIPAIPEYDSMYHWFRNMITHSGIYGHGEKKIIDLQTYIPNIKKILTANLSITLVLITGIATLMAGIFSRKRNAVTREMNLLAALLSVYIFGILLVAKHYGGNHYLIPVMLLAGISLYLIITIVLRLAGKPEMGPYLFPVATLLLAVFIAWNHPRWMIISNRQYLAASEEIDQSSKWLDENYGGYTRINYYIYSINPFTGLKFGNDFAKGKLMRHLKATFPKTYFYELSSDTYTNWNIKTSLHEIVEMNGNRIVVLNCPADTAQIIEMAARGLPLTRVYKGEAQNIYILDTLRYQPEKKNDQWVPADSLFFNADQFSPDGKYFVGSGEIPFGPVNAVSQERVRSGPNSIKLEKSNPFAIDYTIEGTKAGEMYIIEVWRHSDRSEGNLVVAAQNPDDFYVARNEAVILDENGWELLRIRLEITEKIVGQPLKLYLWNPGKRAAYFDDLSVRKFLPREINQPDEPIDQN